MKLFSVVKNSFLYVSLLLASSVANADAFNVDGCFGCDGDNYSVGFEVAFDVNGTPTSGYLFLGQDGDAQSGISQYAYFQMPLAFVDTAYGDEAKAHGWSNGHSFKQIVVSDRLIGFRFPNEGDEVKVDVDVLACVTNCKRSFVNDPANYQSTGFANIRKAGQYKADGHDYNGNATSLIRDVKTSMDYNVGLEGFNVNNSGATGADADKWIYNYGFEFEFQRDVFAFGKDIDSLTVESLANYLILGDSHASPAKEGPGTAPTKVKGRCDPVCTNGKTIAKVPEPSSLAIFGLALMGLVISRRQRV